GLDLVRPARLLRRNHRVVGPHPWRPLCSADLPPGPDRRVLRAARRSSLVAPEPAPPSRGEQEPHQAPREGAAEGRVRRPRRPRFRALLLEIRSRVRTTETVARRDGCCSACAARRGGPPLPRK